MNNEIAIKVLIKFARSPIRKARMIKNNAKIKFKLIFFVVANKQDKNIRQKPKKKFPITLSSPVKLANLPGITALCPKILLPMKNSINKSIITTKKNTLQIL